MRIRTAAYAIWEGDRIVEVIGNIMDITPQGKTSDSKERKLG